MLAEAIVEAVEAELSSRGIEDARELAEAILLRLQLSARPSRSAYLHAAPGRRVRSRGIG